MIRLLMLFVFACWLQAVAVAQQPAQPAAQQPEAPQRVDARQEVIINWTMGDQAWDFKQIRETYEPTKGYLESRPNQGQLAVWKLKLIRELEPGAAKYHDEILGSPFQVVLLDADRQILDSDAPAQITLVSGSKQNDTIELRVGLDGQTLKSCRTIRVQRRTDVGF